MYRTIAVCLVLLVATWSQPLGAAERERLRPTPGVTFVEGRDVRFLRRQPTSAVRVYAAQGDRLVPVPFQVDERDNRGRWKLRGGPYWATDLSPGVIDKNDVVVFLNRDLGRRADVSELPPGATAWAEIRVKSAVESPGFAYVGVFDGIRAPAPAERVYCRYDPETDRVYAERYAVEFGDPLPTHVGFVDRLGELGTNVMSAFRISGEVRFLRGLVRLRRTEQDLQTQLLAYASGPVRVIRRARYWVRMPFGLRASGKVDHIFYPDLIEGTGVVKLHIAPRLLLADGAITGHLDYLDWSGSHLLLDRRQPDAHATRWAALLRPGEPTLLMVPRLEGNLRRLDVRPYFSAAPTGAGKSGRPGFGLEFSRLNRLDAGAHRLTVFAQVLDSSSAADVQRAASAFFSPPEMSIVVLQKRSRRRPAK